MMHFLPCIFSFFLLNVHQVAPVKTSNDGLVKSSEFDTTVDWLLVDQISDTVYVVATNFIYVFGPDLTLKQHKPITRWNIDSGCTSARNCSHGMSMVLMTIEKKVVLIACRSGNQLQCVSMTTGNRYSVNHINITMAPFLPSSTSSFCMFSERGPKHDVLYVGSEPNGLPPQFNVPWLSRLSFELVTDRSSLKQKDSATRMIKNQKFEYETDQKVRFVFGFSHERYAYFLVTETINKTPVKTKLLRIYKDANPFLSYDQTPLYCSNGKLQYNFAETAYFETRKISHNSATLFVAFALTVPDEMDNVNTSMGSVVCRYDIYNISKHLDRNVLDSIKSHSTAELSKNFIGKWKPGVEINEPRAQSDSHQRSSNNVKVPMQELAVLDYPQDILTSLAITVQNNEIVYFVGTERGSFFKATRANSKLIEVKFQDAIKPGAKFSADGRYIYVAGGKQVSRIPVDTCSFHENCQTCISTRDPSGCGWCRYNCSSSKECKARKQFEFFSKESCAPKVFNFSPVSGPVGGDTQINISGQHFGNKTKETRKTHGSSVTIAGKPCEVYLWAPNEIQCFAPKTEHPIEGPLKVVFESSSQNSTTIPGYTSQVNFSLVTPQIDKMSPTYGPIAGGTKVHIFGMHLNTGRSLFVALGNYSCAEPKIISENHIVCLTNRSQSADQVNLYMEIDGAVVASNLTFKYLPNPVIYKDSLNGLETTRYCSANFTFKGKHLNSVENPDIVVHVECDRTMYQFNSTCSTTEDGTRMTCRPPAIPRWVNLGRKVQGFGSLRLDGVDDYSNISVKYRRHPVSEVDGLTFIGFNRDNGTLSISSNNLSLEYKPEVYLICDEYRTKKCVVDRNRSSSSILQCKVSVEEIDLLTKGQWNVTVVLDDLVKQVGTLKFHNGQKASNFQFWGAAVLPLLLIACALIFLYYSYRRFLCSVNSRWQ